MHTGNFGIAPQIDKLHHQPFGLQMDFDTLVCISTLLVRARRCARKRQWWVHPTVSQRLLKGQFHMLYEDLRSHPPKFCNYFRMSGNTYDELLSSIGPQLTFQNTNMRQSVSPEERLAVTLRYLATGNSFASLHFEYLLGSSTIRNIVRHTCTIISEYLKVTCMPQRTDRDWMEIANDFYQQTNFPNCVGAVDGKHVQIKIPEHCGMQDLNYKKDVSIVLLGLVDSDYCFIAIDVGVLGKSGDSNIFKNSDLGKKLEANQLNIPSGQQLPNDDNGKCMPFIVVGNEAFALSQNVLRPYPNRNILNKHRVFNCRLSRARQKAESAFRIMANKWRIFDRSMNVNPDFAHDIVKACCVLHNFVLKRDGIEFEDTLYQCSLVSIPRQGTRANTNGIIVRDYFTNYFTSPQGEVAWQYDKI